MKYLRDIFPFIISLLILCAYSQESYAYSQQYFRPYKATVEGFENRLTLSNILRLTSLPSAQARELLIKAGYKVDRSTNTLIREDYYAHNSDVILYQVGFKENTKGFRKLLIFSLPEMQMIQASFLAGGYTATLVKPRKGAKWTKIFYKKGYPIYSLSMLLLSGMDEQAATYDYYEYVYCLICEKN